MEDDGCTKIPKWFRTLKVDIDIISAVQNKMARALLGVKGSTANVFNSIELGIKPLQFIVYKKLSLLS